MTSGIDWASKIPCGDTHTATSDDANANEISFVSGNPNATGFLVQAFRSGVNIGGDIKASLTAGVLKVEDGSTYKITAADVINWIVF
jgi:hypothetical protein